MLTHEIAKRMVGRGHEVTQFSEQFSGSVSEEEVDGIRIIRSGSAILRAPHVPVHLAAFVWYQRYGHGHFDIIIDEIHGIPFFSSLYCSVPVVALICEVAQELWDATFSYPWNVLGRYVEKQYFRFYRSVPFLTISESSKNDLIQMGVNPKRITVLPMGINVPKQQDKESVKETDPTLLFVARLTKAKGVEDAIEVIRILKNQIPRIKLWIVGSGSSEYMQEIKEKIDAFGLVESIWLFGLVNETEKFNLMKRAHLLIVPSVKEGWGLTVPEAGWFGTPAVGYRVGGLKDVILHEKTGIVTDSNASDMAKEVARLLTETGRYKRYSRESRKLSGSYSWDHTSDVVLSLLSSSIEA